MAKCKALTGWAVQGLILLLVMLYYYYMYDYQLTGG